MLSNAHMVPTLAVPDMDRARRFYEEGLGLAVEADVRENRPRINPKDGPVGGHSSLGPVGFALPRG